MKLVDILARDLKVWPEHCKAIEQDRKGYCIYHAGGGPLDERVDGLADDAETAVVTRAQWRAAVDALKAENCDHLWVGWSDTEACELCNKTRKIYVDWDGAGSPPIGALVQDHSDIGGPVYMAEVVSVEDRLVAIKRPGSLKVVDAHDLRPARTPEQIAAEVRCKAIDDMVKALGMDNPGTAEYIRCGLIYDAGYRKFEIVEGE